MSEIKQVQDKIKKGWVHPAIKKHLEHNKKIKESRARSLSNNLEGLVSDKVDHHYHQKHGRLVSMPLDVRIVEVKKNLCFICQTHDYEMISGKIAGRFFCKEHKSIRDLSETEQEKIRSEYHVEKQNRKRSLCPV